MRRIDFGARSYNASIGRFDRVDLMAEGNTNITPYAISLNNPLYYLDPDGRQEKPAHYEFLTSIGVNIYMQARQNGASSLGALVVLSQAVNESGWGTAKVAREHFNFFGLMGGGSGLTTSHGELASFASAEEGINGYFNKLRKTWPDAVTLLGKENFTSDELNQALNTGKYEKYPAYFVGDSKHTYNYGENLMGGQMSSLLKRFAPALEQRYSENSGLLADANRRLENLSAKYNESGGKVDNQIKREIRRTNREIERLQSWNSMLNQIIQEVRNQTSGTQ